jgi:hypothetical protein
MKLLKMLTLMMTYLAIYTSAHATTLELPSVSGIFKKHVFVDFKTVQYDLNVDLKKKTIRTFTTINFTQNKAGHVVFDLKKLCIKALIDGRKTRVRPFLIPRAMTLAKSVSRLTSVGDHTLEIETRLKKGVNFKNGLDMGLWMRDLYGRKFLEQYLPTNFEYDQYKTIMNINFVSGDHSNITLMANGKIDKKDNGYHIEFPEFYTASSYFIHLFEKTNFIINRSKYRRLDGKEVDYIVYSKNEKFTQDLIIKSKKSLFELEQLYGPWPHDHIIIFGDQSSGGMEHAGATQTSLGSLDHELHHSYFSRAVLPLNGNAGWMDEAIVTWRDRGSPLFERTNFKKHNLACHSVHRRSTDWDSYKKGGNFIGHLAYLFSQKGLEFKDVLKEYFQTYKYQVVTTKVFREFLEGKYGSSLLTKFQRYVCNNKRNSQI